MEKMTDEAMHLLAARCRWRLCVFTTVLLLAICTDGLLWPPCCGEAVAGCAAILEDRIGQ